MTDIRSPERVREYVLSVAAVGADIEVTKGFRGATIGWLQKTLGSSANRRLVIAWLFSHDGRELSSKELDDDKIFALARWIDSYKDDDGWHCGENFKVEAYLVYTEALRHYKNIPPSDRPWEVDFEILGQIVGFAGGVVTNITDEEGNWTEHPQGVELPEEYHAKDSVITTRKRESKSFDV